MTAAQLARKKQKQAARVEREFLKTSRGLAISLVAFGRMKLTELIYAFPIPTRKNGKPMWRRTGNLRRLERADVVNPYKVKVANSAAYALFRHEAGKPGRRPTRYPAHWRDEMVETFRDICIDAYQSTVRDILKK